MAKKDLGDWHGGDWEAVDLTHHQKKREAPGSSIDSMSMKVKMSRQFYPADAVFAPWLPNDEVKFFIGFSYLLDDG